MPWRDPRAKGAFEGGPSVRQSAAPWLSCPGDRWSRRRRLGGQDSCPVAQRRKRLGSERRMDHPAVRVEEVGDRQSIQEIGSRHGCVTVDGDGIGGPGTSEESLGGRSVGVIRIDSDDGHPSGRLSGQRCKCGEFGLAIPTPRGEEVDDGRLPSGTRQRDRWPPTQAGKDKGGCLAARSEERLGGKKCRYRVS